MGGGKDILRLLRELKSSVSCCHFDFRQYFLSMDHELIRERRTRLVNLRTRNEDTHTSRPACTIYMYSVPDRPSGAPFPVNDCGWLSMLMGLKLGHVLLTIIGTIDIAKAPCESCSEGD